MAAPFSFVTTHKQVPGQLWDQTPAIAFVGERNPIKRVFHGSQRCDAEALYERFCAACHGIDGLGDGPASGALVPPPTDLTRSQLSLPELMSVIDGRRTVRAHGTAAMPVRGEVFEQALEDHGRQHRQALREVQAVAEYVRVLRARKR